MKLSLKVIVLGICSMGFLQAMDNSFVPRPVDTYDSDSDASNEVPPALAAAQFVEPFSQENVENFKTVLLRKNDTRFKYQMFVGALAAGAAAYGVYRAGKGIYNWWHEKEERDGLSEQRHSDVVGRLSRLEGNIRIEKDYSRMGWGRYFFEKAKGFGSGVASLAPRIGEIALTSIGASILYDTGMRYIPNPGRYLLEGRTIAWCIETQTSLRRSIRDVAHWADDVVKMQGDQASELCLALSMNVFIKEVEKVIAYVSIVQDRLTPDLEKEIQRAHVSVTLIKKFVGELVRESNNYITTGKQLDKANFVAFVKQKIAGIITQMEKIEWVQQAAGFEELERIETFNNLRAELNPEIKKLRSEKKEFGSMLAELRDLREPIAHIRDIVANAQQQS